MKPERLELTLTITWGRSRINNAAGEHDQDGSSIFGFYGFSVFSALFPYSRVAL